MKKHPLRNHGLVGNFHIIGNIWGVWLILGDGIIAMSVEDTNGHSSRCASWSNAWAWGHQCGAIWCNQHMQSLSRGGSRIHWPTGCFSENSFGTWSVDFVRLSLSVVSLSLVLFHEPPKTNHLELRTSFFRARIPAIGVNDNILLAWILRP